MNLKIKKTITLGLIISLIFGLGVFTGNEFVHIESPLNTSQVIKKDKYVLFVMEVYDKILENYWDNISQEQLVGIYKSNIEKITGKPQKMDFGEKAKKDTSNSNSTTSGNNLGVSLNLAGSSINDLALITKKDIRETNYTEALEKMLNNVLKGIEEPKRKEFTVSLISTILSGLQPAGRSGLFTQKQEQNLKNTVQNINPDKDLYKDLGLAKGASSDEVEQTYKKQEKNLTKENTPESKEKLKQLSYAKEVLTDTDKKKNYDTNKVEPTIASKNLSPDIAYLKFDKFSPTSYQEFIKSTNSYDKEGGPKALIFDLRGNIGGAIDALPFFLGNFLGDKQYAYDFFSKGETQPYKTVGNKLKGLSRMRQMIILVDNQTQSSAELLASSLKRYHFGVVLGTPTKGWGTVERIFPLENQIAEGEKYSMLLVHSITLRDDNQPIEGRGIEPDINITSPDWEKQLLEYFRYPELVTAVKSVI